MVSAASMLLTVSVDDGSILYNEHRHFQVDDYNDDSEETNFK